MASRGRGRGGRGGGRGFGGGFGGFAAQLPFEPFPDEVKLPDVKVNDIDANMKKWLNWGYKHQIYWKASPYFLEETTSKKSQKVHLARYSDKKKTVFTRDSLSQVLVFNDCVKELVEGSSRRMPSRKKFRWNPESEMKKIEFFEQKEKKDQGKGDRGEKEKKDEENEDEDENAEDEEGEEEDEEEFGDDDYNQNEYFDDDEDDYNAADDGDDEPTY